jgi:Flp pilus assembly protein TadG
MFRENQTEQSLRRTRSKQQLAESFAVETFAFGWRSALSAAIYALRSETALAAEVIKANLSEFPQIMPKNRKTNSISKDERIVSQHPRQGFCLLRETEAAALIEFAVALPLLIVLVVGIFDFGGAFNLKQELNNAAREGARFGAAQPSNDLALPQPPSVNAVRFLVDSYLQTAHINDCGLSTATWALASGYTWVFSASGKGCSMTLTVNRQNSVQEVIGGSTVNILCTTVNISYPYQWHFNNVIQLLAPGANYSLGNIPADATAVNMD